MVDGLRCFRRVMKSWSSPKLTSPEKNCPVSPATRPEKDAHGKTIGSSEKNSQANSVHILGKISPAKSAAITEKTLEKFQINGSLNRQTKNSEKLLVKSSDNTMHLKNSWKTSSINSPRNPGKIFGKAT